MNEDMEVYEADISLEDLQHMALHWFLEDLEITSEQLDRIPVTAISVRTH